MAVFVLDKRRKPLMPCTEKRARQLLERGRAVVARMYPFTIRIKDRIGGETQPLRAKLDPGSKGTGFALVREEQNNPGKQHVLWLGEIEHRGQAISQGLTKRRSARRRRRNNLRHRQARFDNRRRKKGWLAPSQRHRVESTTNTLDRLRRLAPITAISQELARFDLQQMENPEISGIEYQQGELAGYEVKEYLLEKWNRCCAYCGASDTPLEVDHIHPESKGGSDRISNLTLACHDCNQRKNADPIEVFLKDKPDVLEKIRAQAKAPLRDAAAVNTTRWALYNALVLTGLPVEVASGGKTKFNRSKLGIPKSHALDAACVGDVEIISGWNRPVLVIAATGRGSYKRTLFNKYGFPRGQLMREKSVHGFQTGDPVKAVVPSGKKAGTHVGRVAIRKTGSFNVTTKDEVVQGISYKYCRLLQRNDGYSYSIKPKTASTRKEAARQAVA